MAMGPTDAANAVLQIITIPAGSGGSGNLKIPAGWWFELTAGGDATTSFLTTVTD